MTLWRREAARAVLLTPLLVLPWLGCDGAFEPVDAGVSVTEPDAGDAGVCGTITLPRAEVVEQQLTADRLPEGRGGRLLDGDYELARHVRWSLEPEARLPSVMRAAARVRDGGAVLDYAFVKGDDSLPDSAASHFSARVQVSGARLLLSFLCPRRDDASLRFTADGDALVLFDGADELELRRR